MCGASFFDDFLRTGAGGGFGGGGGGGAAGAGSVRSGIGESADASAAVLRPNNERNSSTSLAALDVAVDAEAVAESFFEDAESFLDESSFFSDAFDGCLPALFHDGCFALFHDGGFALFLSLTPKGLGASAMWMDGARVDGRHVRALASPSWQKSS